MRGDHTHMPKTPLSKGFTLCLPTTKPTRHQTRYVFRHTRNRPDASYSGLPRRSKRCLLPSARSSTTPRARLPHPFTITAIHSAKEASKHSSAPHRPCAPSGHNSLLGAAPHAGQTPAAKSQHLLQSKKLQAASMRRPPAPCFAPLRQGGGEAELPVCARQRPVREHAPYSEARSNQRQRATPPTTPTHHR